MAIPLQEYSAETLSQGDVVGLSPGPSGSIICTVEGDGVSVVDLKTNVRCMGDWAVACREVNPLAFSLALSAFSRSLSLSPRSHSLRFPFPISEAHPVVGVAG